jgi:hypothetical protein
MKTITIVFFLTVSAVAISGAYNSALADSRMTGKGPWCSSGMNCMADRYQGATAKAAKAKTQKKTQ